MYLFHDIHFAHTVSSSSRERQQIPCKDYFTCPAASPTKTYSAAILRLPTAFYYNALTGVILTGNFVKQKKFPGSVSLSQDIKLLRRSRNDYFRPPYGPPVHYLTSVGYGKEVGLPDGVQEVYDPYTQKNFILDHNTSKIVRDNRVPTKQKHVVKPISISVGSITVKNMPASLCFQAAVIKETFDRAQSKPIGCTLSLHGRNGHTGVDGAPGMEGVPGKNASCFGRHGMSGGCGKRGKKGNRGTNGQKGGDALLTLSGTADELVVKGREEFKVHLGGTKSEQVLLIDCHGGDGGRGGYGGGGGDGGNGGNGSNGAPGKSTNVCGRNGGDGGHGGDGGNGGSGGQGGDAGDGGNGGSGGKCLIQTADPKLLMLVEVDCMPGTPGAGAKGGEGGRSGYPGRGGIGGAGGSGGPPISYTLRSGDNSITTYQYTSSGKTGRNGRSGDHGRSGGICLDSTGGGKGQSGGILWAVCGPSVGGKTKTSSTRYNAKVEGFKVTPVLEGGIFEPNEIITVSSVLVHNNGGLALPDGVSVSMCSSLTVNFEASKFEIPQNILKAGQKCTIPFKFYGRLSDLAPPNAPGLHTFKAKFHSRIELLGRPFEKSFFKKELLVQYPIQLGDLCSPEMMDQGELSVISVEVKNISNLPYGRCESSGGRVVLQLHFDSRLIPLGKITADAQAPYVMSYDHSLTDSVFIELLQLPPKSKATVNIKVQMESHAEFFDQCLWQVDLHLRDKLVEYNLKNIRVTPKYYTRKMPADALLVTNEVMTHQEFQFWYHIFHLLGVSFDIWDTALYNGFSVDNHTGLRHKHSWYGRYHGKLILYPHCNSLELLAGVDIAHHFHGSTFREKPLQEINSSLVVFMPKSKFNEMKVLRHLAVVHPSIEVPKNDYSGSHLSMPTLQDSPAPYKNCEKKLVKRIEENDLSQAPLLLSRRVRITHIKFLKYSYGQVDIRQVPILKSSKLLLVGDSERLSDVNVSSSDTDITSLASKYGQTILAFLYGISIPTKLKLIKKETSVPNDIVFYLPNASIMGMEELAMITLAWEVADELFSLSGEAHRMKQIYTDIMDNTLAYVECGRVVLRGLKLIEKEFNKRRSAGLKHYLVMQAYGKLTEMCKGIQKILAESGVNNSKLEDMPSLDQLQDRSYVHFCHQHFVKDDQWNLART